MIKFLKNLFSISPAVVIESPVVDPVVSTKQVDFPVATEIKTTVKKPTVKKATTRPSKAVTKPATAKKASVKKPVAKKAKAKKAAK